MSPRGKRDVLIAFDEDDSRGPHLYIGVKYQSDLEDAIGLFELLASGGLNEVELANRDAVWLENLDSLVLRVAGSGRSDLTITRKEGRILCDWVCTREDWEAAAELVRAMLPDRPGFQYLPPNSVAADAAVEFDYGGLAAQARRKPDGG
jgi:hypothetical protein